MWYVLLLASLIVGSGLASWYLWSIRLEDFNANRQRIIRIERNIEELRRAK